MALTFAAVPAAPETFNVLLYGPPKAGKTTAAATAPGPIMWLNLEGPGALGYARRVAAHRNVDIHEVRPAREANLHAVLSDVVRHITSGEQPQVQTLVVDTMGKMRDHLARNIGGAHPQIQHWGEVAKIIEGFVVALRDWPINVVLLAHEAIKDSDAGDRIVEPLIGGATTAKVCGEVDVIAYCGRVEDDQGVRYMGVLAEHNGRRAGDRSGGLGKSRPLDLAEWLSTYSAALSADGQPSTVAAPAAVPSGAEIAAVLSDDERTQLVQTCAARGHQDMTMLLTSVGAESTDELTVAQRDSILSKLADLPASSGQARETAEVPA
jgi:hypothetical protein